MRKVEQSSLAAAIVEARVIPYGVDLSVFRPGDQQAARRELGLPRDAHVLLFAAANARRNYWKDYGTLRASLGRLANGESGAALVMIALGENGPTEQVGAAELRPIGFQPDPAVVSRYYQAADVYVHAAHADTFPNAILEALACGTPVVATAVGGIPEQVADGVTGYLVPPGDSAALATRISQVLTDSTLRSRLRQRAALTAAERFNAGRQVDAYLSWYAEALTAERPVNVPGQIGQGV